MYQRIARATPRGKDARPRHLLQRLRGLVRAGEMSDRAPLFAALRRVPPPPQGPRQKQLARLVLPHEELYEAFYRTHRDHTFEVLDLFHGRQESMADRYVAGQLALMKEEGLSEAEAAERMDAKLAAQKNSDARMRAHLINEYGGRVGPLSPADAVAAVERNAEVLFDAALEDQTAKAREQARQRKWARHREEQIAQSGSRRKKWEKQDGLLLEREVIPLPASVARFAAGSAAVSDEVEEEAEE